MTSTSSGFRLTEIYAYLAVGDDNDEGIPVAHIGDVAVPLVAANGARLEDMREWAQQFATQYGQRVVLSRFTGRTDVEVLEP